MIVLPALILAACAGQPSATQAPAVDLGGTTWKLVSVNNANALPDDNVVVFFGPTGALVGYTGCNLLSGNYMTSGANIDIQPSVTPPFACLDAMKVQEEALLSVLTKASSAQTDGDSLILGNPDNSLVAKFSLQPLQPLAGTSWKVSAYNDGKGALVDTLEGTELTAQFGEDGNLTGSAGCNTYTAAYKTEENKITVEAPVATRMACAEPQGVMEQEAACLAAIQSAASYQSLAVVMVIQSADGKPAASFITASK